MATLNAVGSAAAPVPPRASSRPAPFGLTGSGVWSFFTVLAVAMAFLDAPTENRYAGAIAGSVVFVIVQWALPECRLVTDNLLCPWNWALFVFYLQLVLLPLSVVLFGPSQGVLPFLPSDEAINLAMLVNAGAFVAFSGCYAYFLRRSREPGNTLPSEGNSGSVRLAPPLGYVALSGVVGLVGFLLAFGTLNKLKEYFADPAGYLSRLADVSDKLGPAAGQFLRPFLGICIVMLWCRWLDLKRHRKAATAITAATILAMLGVCFCNSTFNYNRGSIIVPLVAMLAVLICKRSRLPHVTALAAGAVLLIVLVVQPFYGVYRNSSFTGAELLDDPSTRNALAERVELAELFQVYGGAPQFLGFFMEAGHWGASPMWGKVLASSALAPLPILGKSFRESSGTAIYNRWIYGMLPAQDQIAPFQGEAFLDFSLVGVLAGFSLLGWIAFKLQRAFAQSDSLFEMFTWQYFSIWIFFLIFGSLSVVSQIFIYFCWPMYLYFLYRSFERAKAVR